MHLRISIPLKEALILPNFTPRGSLALPDFPGLVRLGDFRFLEVLEGFPNCSTKKLNKEPSHLAFFTVLDPTEY